MATVTLIRVATVLFLRAATVANKRVVTVYGYGWLDSRMAVDIISGKATLATLGCSRP